MQQNADWAHLPATFLADLTDQSSLAETARLTGVCKSWRKAILQIPEVASELSLQSQA